MSREHYCYHPLVSNEAPPNVIASDIAAALWKWLFDVKKRLLLLGKDLLAES